MMRRSSLAGLSLIAAAVMLLIGAAPAAAYTYTVTSDSYSNSTSTSYYYADHYEFTAQTGQAVSYSVSVSSGCVMVYFAAGHSLGSYFDYYDSYSRDYCSSSTYSNTFTVSSSDGTDFSIIIGTNSYYSYSYYAISINKGLFGMSSTVLAIAIIAIIAAVVVVIVIVVVVSSKKKKAQPPMYQQPQMYPQQPQMYQQQQPWQQPPQQPPWQPPSQP